jgi:hypothetical protein
MRLTLRTLLAWLDDTLPPAEVRQIGQQVNESPFAKELVERIHRVARQRRLTVPASSGPDGTDPALVASYLDNELSPEQVAEFEKKCLTSDVHLAEVASCHQILSLIGQKAKVPPEAKQRMYHLVKGREAVGSHAKVPRQFPPPREPAAAPVAPWAPPEPPHRSALERYGPPAAVVGLMALLVWSALTILNPGAGPGGGTGYEIVSPGTKATPASEAAKAGPDQAAPTLAPLPGLLAEGTQPPAPEEKEKDSGKDAAKEKEPPPLPPGAVGVVSKADGLLLRARPDAPTKWERLAAQAPLRDGDRIVSLAPFRPTLDLGGAKVELVRHAEVKLRRADPGTAAHFELVLGRVVLHGASPAAPVLVDFARNPVTITPAEGGVVGLERVDSRKPGEPETSPPGLRVYAPEGQVALAAGDATATLSGPGSLTYLLPKTFTPKKDEAPPRWVGEPPSPADEELGKKFAANFKDGEDLLRSLVTAQEDDLPEIRSLSISALAALGSLDMVATALSTPGDKHTRRAAIRALRAAQDRGPAAAKDVRAVLEDLYGKEGADEIEKLLLGFTAAERGQAKTYERLVADLKSPVIGIRELALDDLQALTGRDALGYDPDTAEGPGLKSWQDLLQRKELPPKAATEEKEKEKKG